MGEYEIVRRLRVGGMATLYLARRYGAAGFSRLVALKVVHPHLLEQPAVIEMFVDEARICSQITHPNIVHVEEFGVIDGVHYLVMEYIDGCSVYELLQMLQGERRQLHPEHAARVIMQIAGGLHAAHEAVDANGRSLDIIHRDISPSNILLSPDGNAKLIDFGIAKARNRLSETEAGVTLKGKFNYVAPEQATRSSIDRRSDIFSLGVVFWEMLAGQPLFVEETYVALFNRLDKTEVVPPSSIAPGVPESLDAIVLSMLQHEPALRPQSANEVRRRIASAVPSAANLDASELGKMVVEVRDKRAASRSGTEDRNPDSLMNFSPTPRSSRTQSEEYRLKLAGRAETKLPIPGIAPEVGAVPPAWRRYAPHAAIASLLAVVVTLIVVVVGRGSSRTGAHDKPTSLPVEPISAPAPAPPVNRSPGQPPPLPSTSSQAPMPSPTIEPAGVPAASGPGSAAAEPRASGPDKPPAQPDRASPVSRPAKPSQSVVRPKPSRPSGQVSKPTAAPPTSGQGTKAAPPSAAAHSAETPSAAEPAGPKAPPRQPQTPGKIPLIPSFDETNTKATGKSTPIVRDYDQSSSSHGDPSQ
ncbi:MAG TPA: protein kinase [Kofleriaceae bacterium]|nr:protein kinase [Kofleriaceae bacterium]